MKAIFNKLNQIKKRNEEFNSEMEARESKWRELSKEELTREIEDQVEADFMDDMRETPLQF